MKQHKLMNGYFSRFKILLTISFFALISEQLLGQSLLQSSGSAGNYAVTYPANLAGVVPAGMMLVFRANHSVSGIGATLNVNGISTIALKKQFNQDIITGDITQNQFVTVIYDDLSAVWQMLSVTATPPSGINFWTTSGNNLTPINISQNLALGTSQGSASLNIKGKSDNSTNYALVITSSTNGINFVVRDDGFVGIGTTAPGYMLQVNGRIKSNGLNETSDVRLKKDIEKLTNVLSKLIQLQGVSYRMKGAESDSKKEIGLIAQEVETIFPELVATDVKGLKSIEYSRVVALLIEAIKEQERRILNYEFRITNLESETKNTVELRSEFYKLKEDLNRSYPIKSEK